MTRDLTTAVSNEVEAQVVQPFLLAELMFDGDPVRAWNGVGTLRWNGNDYTGVGDLGGIDPISETSNIQARGIAFSLSGVPSATISLALGSNYSGRIARLRLGFFAQTQLETESGEPILTESGDQIHVEQDASIIQDPFVIAEGFMDQLDIMEEGETSQVTIKAESRLITLHRAREFLYDHEDQQAIYPGDRGFEFVPALQNKEISWGVGTGRANGPRRIRPPTSGPDAPPRGGPGPGPGSGSGSAGAGPGGGASGPGAGGPGGGSGGGGSGPGPGGPGGPGGR